jgi:hypothetical protein
MADRLFDAWCSEQTIPAKTCILLLLVEKPGAQSKVIELLQELVPKHYCKPALISKWLKKWGYRKALKIVRDNLPEGKKARSGDLGEILATEYVNRRLEFRVPIFRLRWRDHRELALRGDDLFGVKLDGEGKVHFLKGEAKSRQVLAHDVITAANLALSTHDGRPSPHTVNFVLQQLNDVDEEELCNAIEGYLTSKRIPKKRVTHLLFAFCGNNPQPQLQSHVTRYSSTIQQIVVGLRVKDHGGLVKTVYAGVKLA